MFANSMKTLRLLPKAAFFTLLLAAPVLAVPAARGDIGSTIEAPALSKKGAGLVILVSLQRA